MRGSAMNESPSSSRNTDAQQLAKLCLSIRSAIRPIEFEQILLTHGAKVPATLTSSTDYADVVAAVVEDADRAGWMPKLLAALFYAKEGTSFGDFVAKMGQLYGGQSGFQSLVVDVDGLFDWRVMAYRADVISRHVCLISIDNLASGTGVLVGPDLVLTNHHVVNRLINNGQASDNSEERISVLFDFFTQLQPNGRFIINNGKSFGVARRWLVASSVPHPSEVSGTYPDDGVHAVRELDYALLRIDTSVGNEILPDGSTRSWTALKAPARPLDVLQRVHISQHAAGQPLKGATGRISAIPPHKARVRYQVTTLNVSSGSPCWDNDFQLVALHNVGGISCRQGVENQGIPIDRIIADLNAAGPPGSLILPQPAPPGSAGSAALRVSPTATSPPVIRSVGGDYPVLNRPALFRALVAVAAATGSQVLLVNGPRYSGRSFTSRVVQQFLRPAGHHALTVPGTALMDKSPEQVLTELRNTLDLPTLPNAVGAALTTRTAEVGRHLLSAWLSQLRGLYPARPVTGAAPTQIWFVFDGLDQITIADETHDLIAEVTRRAGEVPMLRLVLTGYERALPAEVESTAEREQIEPPTVEDIFAHLQWAADASSYAASDDELRVLARGLLEAVSTDPAKRMGDIGKRVRDTIRAMRETRVS
jgi:hypothetical protein